MHAVRLWPANRLGHWITAHTAAAAEQPGKPATTRWLRNSRARRFQQGGRGQSGKAATTRRLRNSRAKPAEVPEFGVNENSFLRRRQAMRISLKPKSGTGGLGRLLKDAGRGVRFLDRLVTKD